MNPLTCMTFINTTFNPYNCRIKTTIYISDLQTHICVVYIYTSIHTLPLGQCNHVTMCVRHVRVCARRVQ
jgi:hypothetical protein